MLAHLKNDEVWYECDMKIRNCSCPFGTTCSPCKHEFAVSKHFNEAHFTVAFENFLRSRVRKNENFPDSKIFVAKTFRIKRVNCINFQIRDKYA